MTESFISVDQSPFQFQPSDDATHEPYQKKNVLSFFITLAIMVSGFSSIVIKQVLLPSQVLFLDPKNYTASFFVIASSGAIAGVIATPLVGAFSDRTTLRWGPRRPWILVGIVAAVIGMIVMARATTIPLLLFGEVVAQMGVDSLLATVTALIPDHFSSQRTLISSFVGLAPNVGGMLGLLLVTHFTDTQIVAQGYYLMSAVSLVCGSAILFVVREKPLSREKVTSSWHVRQAIGSFFQPFQSANFCYAFASRGCAYLAFTLLGAFLLFYLHGFLHLSVSDAAAHVTTFQLVSTMALCAVAVCTGLFSTRAKAIHFFTLKVILISGAVIMALGLALMAFVPVWIILVCAAIVFGWGFGAYVGGDIKLVLLILERGPAPRSYGKDLGILYTAIFIPLIISPALGTWLLALSQNDFALPFLAASCSSVLAALFVLPMKITME